MVVAVSSVVSLEEDSVEIPSLQALVLFKLRVGVDILVVTIGNPVSIDVSIILQDGFRT